MIKIVFILGFFILFGCSSKTSGDLRSLKEGSDSVAKEIPTVFYIDKNQSYEKKSIDVHTLAEVVDYIPLETPDDGLIPKSDTRVESILATATEVFIVSLNKIFRFGRNGKFLNTIGRIGEGPQEYVTLIDMVLNRTKKEVIIYDGGKQSLMIYAYDGSFLRSIPLNPNWAVRIGLLDEKTICAVNVPNKNVPGFFLISLENGKMIEALSKPYPTRSGISSLILGIMSTPRSDGSSVFFNSMLTDTLFAINTHSRDPRYIQLPPNNVVGSGKCGDCSSPHLIFGTDAYANVVIFENTPPAKSYFIDKKKQKIYRGVMCDGQSGGKLIQLINTGGKNEIATLYQPFWLKEQLGAGLLSGRLKEIAQNVHEDDNPIIAIYKLKD